MLGDCAGEGLTLRSHFVILASWLKSSVLTARFVGMFLWKIAAKVNRDAEYLQLS